MTVQIPSAANALSAASDGTPVSVGSLYEEHIRFVWDFLRYLGVAPADLEDVAHEVFMVVHRLLPACDTSRPMRPWITGIAVRVAADYRKRAHRRRELPVEDLQPAGDDPQGEAQLDQKRRQALLHELLQSLAPQWRAVFLLHDVEEHGAPEIAQMLGVPVNTVYSRLRRARRKLEAGVARLKKRGLL